MRNTNGPHSTNHGKSSPCGVMATQKANRMSITRSQEVSVHAKNRGDHGTTPQSVFVPHLLRPVSSEPRANKCTMMHGLSLSCARMRV